MLTIGRKRTDALQNCFSKLYMTPTSVDISDLIAHALFMLGKTVTLAWRAGGQAEYHLVLKFHSRNANPHWWLYKVRDEAKTLLWTTESYDVLQMFNLVMFSTGDNTQVAADPSLCCTKTAPNQIRKYFVRLNAPAQTVAFSTLG